MKIIIAGGSGQLGVILVRSFQAKGHDVVVLSRSPCAHGRWLAWDGRGPDGWMREVDGADVVINLAGRSVNCRYTPTNLREMMESRVESTRAIAMALAAVGHPPRVWLQMSTATIYAHRYDAPNDEVDGFMGGSEPDAPDYWSYSVRIAQAWERALMDADVPRTRRVAMRTAMVMSPDPGGVFDVLIGLVRCGLGGTVGEGRQFVSWITDHDFVRAVDLLITHDDISGPVNITSPNPIPQREFMAILRSAWGFPVGLKTPGWMAEIGAFIMRTDTELLLKSRRVIPGRLLNAGFRFDWPSWESAAVDLIRRWSDRRSKR